MFPYHKINLTLEGIFLLINQVCDKCIVQRCRIQLSECCIREFVYHTGLLLLGLINGYLPLWTCEMAKPVNTGSQDDFADKIFHIFTWSVQPLLKPVNVYCTLLLGYNAKFTLYFMLML